MRPGSPQAAAAYDRHIASLADAYWAAPMPVCEKCGCEHNDEDSALCEECVEAETD